MKINDRSLKNEKDFDAIYLDKPTNLIVPLGDNLEEKEFVKYLFQNGIFCRKIQKYLLTIQFINI